MHWIQPSPVESIDATSLDINASLFIKRESELLTEKGASYGLYGGSKLRKLVLFTPDIIQKNDRSICTVGSEGSHHVLATVRFAQALGVSSHCLLTDQLHSPHSQQIYEQIRESATSITHVKLNHPKEFSHALQQWKVDHTGYWIPTGGSTPLSALGMCVGALELKAQIDMGLMPNPNTIYIAVGSGSSFAGLQLGLHLGWASTTRPQLVGIRVTPRVLVTKQRINRLIKRSAQLIHDRINTCDPTLLDAIRVHTDWKNDTLWKNDSLWKNYILCGEQIGEGYAIPTMQSTFALDWTSKQGIKLDPSYTAKAFAGLIAYEQSIDTQDDRVVLFWHTHDERPLSETSRTK